MVIDRHPTGIQNYGWDNMYLTKGVKRRERLGLYVILKNTWGGRLIA